MISSVAKNPVRYVAASGNQSIDGILDGAAWTATTLDFSIPASPDYEAGDSEAAQGFRSVSPAQHAVADCTLTGTTALPGYPVTKLGSVASFTNETFTDAGAGPATVMLASSSLPATSQTYTPGIAAQSGDVWFGQAFDASPSLDLRTPVLGNYAYFSVVHELGHALGLKHGNETGGVANEALPSASDDVEYSLMTYSSYIGSPAQYDTCGPDSRPQTFMMDDIAALQYLYGANFSVVGPTTYRWDPATGETSINGVGQGKPSGNKVFQTIWNGDGKEATYDFSQYASGVQVNLNPGACSVTSAAQLADLGAGNSAKGNVYNAMQFQNDPRSLIANAFGGSGNDAIVGNAADNLLKGGLGANAIDGGGGTNTALYDVTRQQASISLASDGTVQVAFQGGQDSLRNIQALHFSNEVVATASMPWLAYTATASGSAGTVAMDDPGAGAPSYLQAQFINAGAAGQALSTQAPNVFIHGGSGDDAIQVSAGRNVLDGGLGSNFLIGGTGTDTFFTDARAPGTVWNTIRNLHAGDAATLWGFDSGVSSYRWDGVAGVSGFQGATLRANIAGGAGRTGSGIDASITFAGLSVQQAQGLQITTGTQPGGSYLYIYDPGV
jgi:serralysin